MAEQLIDFHQKRITVEDKDGKQYTLERHPKDGYLQRLPGGGMEFHLVFSTERPQEKQKEMFGEDPF